MTGQTADEASSLRAVVANRIRDAIVAGELPPGHRLREEEVAVQYGASRLPVREAFAQLKAEGFIELVRFRGAAVAVPTPSAGTELLQVRQSLEGLAARLAAQRRGGGEADRLRVVVDVGKRLVDQRRYDELPALIEQFHDLVAAASGNGQLVEMLRHLRHKMSWVFRIDLPERSAASWHEHGEILRAVLGGFPAVAETLMTQHVGADVRVFEDVAGTAVVDAVADP